ncbi:G0/G1 switch protein 2 [Sphaeramia orbicularis]|uniref:G0/G1 switch protein 2 n=1 Tax=Sphaeramia orbicularis TaxID=375764 RepID=UPI00117C12F8|nr:G0/G1 switch protein 2 [Sphaeramia orbicularis]
METMQELIPFAKEMLSQKPARGLLKVYLVGSVFAVLGTVIGLVQTVCQPFMSDEPMDAELVLALARDQRTVQTLRLEEEEEEEEEEAAAPVHQDGATAQTTTLSKTPGLNQRSSGKRLHAS